MAVAHILKEEGGEWKYLATREAASYADLLAHPDFAKLQGHIQVVPLNAGKHFYKDTWVEDTYREPTP